MDVKDDLKKAVDDGAAGMKAEESRISSGLEKALQEAKGTAGQDIAEAKAGLERLALKAEELAKSYEEQGWRWIRGAGHWLLGLAEKATAWAGQRFVVIGFAIVNASLAIFGTMTRIYPEVHLRDMAQRARLMGQLADEVAKAREQQKQG